MPFGVNSEVGRLRQVMVHRPGPRTHPPDPVQRRRAALRRDWVRGHILNEREVGMTASQRAAKWVGSADPALLSG